MEAKNEQAKRELERQRIRRYCIRLGLGMGIGVVVLFGLFPLIAIAWYEFGDAGRVRNAVGTSVVFIAPETGIFSKERLRVGRLAKAGYRFNDKFGWFDLYIDIEGGPMGGGIGTGLAPWELWRVQTDVLPMKPGVSALQFIERGMTRQDVRDRLGEPANVLSADGEERWVYPTESQVFCDVIFGKNGRVHIVSWRDELPWAPVETQSAADRSAP